MDIYRKEAVAYIQEQVSLHLLFVAGVWGESEEAAAEIRYNRW